MNTQQKIQVGLGGLLILGGIAIAFVNPVVGGLAVSTGISVAGFSNTVTKAVSNAVSK